METCDVLIVGGGPAGSACAGQLQRAGHDVLVIDKREFPRDKTCAGWVTPPVLDVLDIDRDEYSASRILQPIRGFRTGVIGGEEITTCYDDVVSYGIRRCEFDQFLLDRSSARRRLGYPVKALAWQSGRWIINDEIETPLLVGAGGHFCPVARHLGARPKTGASVVTAQEIEYPAREADLARMSVTGEIPELFFCKDLAGYGWCFRKGNFLNIGLGRVNSRDVGTHLQMFCEFLRDRGKVCGDIPPRFHGHAYQLYEGPAPSLVGENVMLIGDAAGLAYPQSGEGIRPAVESGLLAARTILQAGIHAPLHELQAYERAIHQRFGTRRGPSATHWLPASWLHGLAARLLASRWFSKHVVLDRWFLHRQQAALKKVGH